MRRRHGHTGRFFTVLRGHVWETVAGSRLESSRRFIQNPIHELSRGYVVKSHGFIDHVACVFILIHSDPHKRHYYPSRTMTARVDTQLVAFMRCALPLISMLAISKVRVAVTLTTCYLFCLFSLSLLSRLLEERSRIAPR